jgi:hypothetical protein
MSVPYTPGSIKYIVNLYENPDESYSASEITSTKPLWTNELQDINFVQYPVSGVKPLVPGRTYYWQVTGILQGPVNATLQSDLFVFRAGDLSLSGLTPSQKEIFKYLEMILGKNYAYILKEIRNLKPDETFVLDGKKISVDELGDLARAFALSKKNLKKVSLK